jgi:hypothetical protein
MGPPYEAISIKGGLRHLVATAALGSMYGVSDDAGSIAPNSQTQIVRISQSRS